LAAIVGLPLMRTSTLAIPISTFAFLIVAYNVLANWEAVTGGSAGLVSIPTTTSVETAGLWAAVAVVVALAFKWSASGYLLQATREDEVAARSLGVGVMRERMLAFALSGMLCGAGGALAVHQSGVLIPSTFYFGATVTTLTMLVVGGTRSVFGAVLGALAVAGVNELLRGFEDGASLFGLVSIGPAPGLAAIGLGLILLVTMIAMPDGLTGGREAGEMGWMQRRASIPAPPVEQSSSSVSGVPRGEGALRAEGISLAFSGLRVLRRVDLELRRGEALGLIGPNGAGKTTLVNVLSGFQLPRPACPQRVGAQLPGRPSLPPPERPRERYGRGAGGRCRQAPGGGDRRRGAGEARPARAGRAAERLAAARRTASPGDRPGACHRASLSVARRARRGPERGRV
jgi:branched-chain amino acid transport system permease protein